MDGVYGKIRRLEMELHRCKVRCVEEIKQLKDDLDEFGHASCNQLVKKLKQELHEIKNTKLRYAKKQITQLKADLAKFAGHTAECHLFGWTDQDFAECVELGHKCDCGYEQDKERWNK